MFNLRDFAARTHFVILSEVSSANAVEESRTASRPAARVSALAGTKPVPVSLLAERSILSSDSAQDSVGFLRQSPFGQRFLTQLADSPARSAALHQLRES